MPWPDFDVMEKMLVERLKAEVACLEAVAPSGASLFAARRDMGESRRRRTRRSWPTTSLSPKPSAASTPRPRRSAARCSRPLTSSLRPSWSPRTSSSRPSSSRGRGYIR